MKSAKLMALIIISAAAGTVLIRSHCEVPCGIYDDEMRFSMLEEHAATIEKAVHQVRELTSQAPQNMNQIVRWVMTKENHAQEIQHIVSQYFLTQRIKIEESPDYSAKLMLCHRILVSAMKTKQSLETENVEALKKAVAEFKELYFKKK